MTFSEQIWYGLFKPSKYKELLELKARRSVLFVVVLVLVLSLVTFVVPTSAVIAGFGGMNKLFSETMAPVKYDGESLSIEKPFRMTADGTIFIIDSAFYTVPDQELKRDGNYIAVGSKNMRVTTVIGGEIWFDSITPLEQVIEPGFSNDSLISIIPAIYISMFICFLIMGLTFFLKYGFYAVVLTIVVCSWNRTFKLGLSYGQSFMLCFYGQSLGIVLTNFNLVMGLLSPGIVSFVTVLVSIHFIYTGAMLMHKDNQV